MGERALLAAILERVILDIVGEEADKHERAAARRFVAQDFILPFSFPWICQTLDIDIQKFRAVIDGKEGGRRKANKV